MENTSQLDIAYTPAVKNKGQVSYQTTLQIRERERENNHILRLSFIRPDLYSLNCATALLSNGMTIH